MIYQQKDKKNTIDTKDLLTTLGENGYNHLLNYKKRGVMLLNDRNAIGLFLEELNIKDYITDNTSLRELKALLFLPIILYSRELDKFIEKREEAPVTNIINTYMHILGFIAVKNIIPKIFKLIIGMIWIVFYLYLLLLIKTPYDLHEIKTTKQQ